MDTLRYLHGCNGTTKPKEGLKYSGKESKQEQSYVAFSFDLIWRRGNVVARLLRCRCKLIQIAVRFSDLLVTFSLHSMEK